MKYKTLLHMVKLGFVDSRQDRLYNGRTYNLDGAICRLHGTVNGWDFEKNCFGYMYWGENRVAPDEVIDWFGRDIYEKIKGQKIAIIEAILEGVVQREAHTCWI